MKKLNVRLDRCTGCKRCETACTQEHTASRALPSGDHGESPRIFLENLGDRAVPEVCRHCEEALCVSACMSGCMQKDPVTGVVTNMGHEQKCVGCWMCVMACPFGVIVPSGAPERPGTALFQTAMKCDFCPNRNTPACVEACPNEALLVAHIGGRETTWRDQ